MCTHMPRGCVPNPGPLAGSEGPTSQRSPDFRHTVVSWPGLALQYYLNTVLSGNVAFAKDYFVEEESPLVLYLLWFCIFLITPIPFGAHQLLRVDQISS